LELDETNIIRVSSFDSVRREIARRSLETLIKDSRIQPSRIEEVVRQTKVKMEEILLEEGKIVAENCGVYNLPVEVLKLLGRYKFRTSYGQNLALHTIEETKIGVAIAAEIGAKVETVRLGCLLHDIGKVSLLLSSILTTSSFLKRWTPKLFIFSSKIEEACFSTTLLKIDRRNDKVLLHFPFKVGKERNSYQASSQSSHTLCSFEGVVDRLPVL